MSPADWRQLIEAYLEGRLSAETFARRYVEAFQDVRRAGGSVPRPIAELFSTVEDFAANLDGASEGEFDEDPLREAVRRARAELDASSPLSGARTYDRARAREEMRRFQVQMSGCAGVGCLAFVIWIGLCVLQVFAVSDQIQSVLDWPAALATLAGVALAFVPVLGNIIAFFGARDVWHWSELVAAIVFLAAPTAAIISGWTRWQSRTR